MLSFELPRDQHLVTAGIGFEMSLLDCTKGFISPGRMHIGYPRVEISGNYKAFPVTNYASTGAIVPLIYARGGYVHFDTAHWGIEDRMKGTVDSLRQAQRNSSIGLPAMIPGSFMDIGGKTLDGESVAVRLRPQQGDYLYIACVYRPNERSMADSVSVLVCEPGPDIKEFANWQPVIVPVDRGLDLRNFEFITPKNNRRFLGPSPKGSLLVETIAKPNAA